jgi:hypothetical protein
VGIPTEALPFAAATGMSVLGAICSWAVGKRTPSLVRDLNEKLTPAQAPKGKIPQHLTPGGIAKFSVWAADCAQSLVVLISPAVAGLLLVEHHDSLVGLAYIALLVIGVGVFVYLLVGVDPDRYARSAPWGLTWIGMGAVAVNLVVTVAVSLLTN